MKPRYLAIAIVALYLLCAARRPAAPSRERIVNETLNMTLFVGIEMSDAHKRPTWDEIQREVCRRLHVKRTAPWEVSR